MTDLFHGEKTVVGAKQLRKAVREGRVKAAFIASDAEERVTRPVLEACQEADVSICTDYTMKDLGAACGIEVGAAVAGLLK